MTIPIPDLSIVIISWNVCDLLRSCLRAIDRERASTALEVILVDAASVDGSLEMVQAEFPWVKLIVRSDNVGFPKGNNLGIAKAIGRHVLLLNPDTEVLKGALGELVSFMDNHPSVGIVGPQLLNTDGSVQSSRRRFPTLITAVFESTWLEPWAPVALLQHYYALDLSDDTIAEVDWLVGACLLVRRVVIEQVGLLDEAYFMYSEELDWCHRIRMADWRIVYFPVAKVVHHGGKSSEQAVAASHISFQQAKLRYFRKYHGRLAAAVLRTILLLNYVLQLIFESVKAFLGHKRIIRHQRIGVYWRVLRSGLFPAGYKDIRPDESGSSSAIVQQASIHEQDA